MYAGAGGGPKAGRQDRRRDRGARLKDAAGWCVSMLRRQLKDLDAEYAYLERCWVASPRFELAVVALRWCKRKRDMFDSADGSHSNITGYVSEHLALTPMVCRVDVLGHVEKWEERVRVWRARFQGFG